MSWQFCLFFQGGDTTSFLKSILSPCLKTHLSNSTKNWPVLLSLNCHICFAACPFTLLPSPPNKVKLPDPFSCRPNFLQPKYTDLPPNFSRTPAFITLGIVRKTNIDEKCVIKKEYSIRFGGLTQSTSCNETHFSGRFTVLSECSFLLVIDIIF